MDGVTPALASREARHDGAARIRWGVDADGRTRLADLFQRAPLRVLLPDAVDDAVPHAVLLNTAGGLVGGDRLEIEIALEPGARALVTQQAAEKVYRSAGADVTVANRLAVGDRAWLEWLPQETILFEGARLRRRLTLDLAGSGAALAGEILVFGRHARGERMLSGAAFDGWEIRRDGRLLWADALDLGDDPGAALGSSAGFGGAVALGTLVCAIPDAASRLDAAREALGDTTEAGASVVGEILLVRFLDARPDALRRRFAAVWAALRRAALGLPPVLPRVWHV